MATLIEAPAALQELLESGPLDRRRRYVDVRSASRRHAELAEEVKTGWIGLGLSIEIEWNDRRIVTQPVHAVRRHVRLAPLGLVDRSAA